MRAVTFLSLFAAALGFACLMSADARAEQCKINTCVTLTPTKAGSGWKVHIKVRTTAGNYEFFNVIVPGQSQLEVDGPGNNAEFDFDAPADWNGIVSAQACIDDRPIETRCDPWATFNADFPKVTPALSAPDARFCDWYATEAVARAAQGAKCGFTGVRWNPDKQAQYGWCIQQKSQQQGWSEHNARVGQLADCAKKEVANAPPKANQSVGAPIVTVKAEVDIYKQPGGEGKPFGSVKAGTSVQVYEHHPDQWCYIAGHDVPDPGNGWVWCGQGFELN